MLVPVTTKVFCTFFSLNFSKNHNRTQYDMFERKFFVTLHVRSKLMYWLFGYVLITWPRSAAAQCIETHRATCAGIVGLCTDPTLGTAFVC